MNFPSLETNLKVTSNLTFLTVRGDEEHSKNPSLGYSMFSTVGYAHKSGGQTG